MLGSTEAIGEGSKFAEAVMSTDKLRVSGERDSASMAIARDSYSGNGPCRSDEAKSHCIVGFGERRRREVGMGEDRGVRW